jgi:hypothetical protein
VLGLDYKGLEEKFDRGELARNTASGLITIDAKTGKPWYDENPVSKGKTNKYLKINNIKRLASIDKLTVVILTALYAAEGLILLAQAF